MQFNTQLLPDFPDLEQAEVLQELNVITKEEKRGLIGYLDKTTFTEEQKKFLVIDINNCESGKQLDLLIKAISLNIIEDKDRISMGFNYNMSDLKKTLQQLR